jgi:hypothetical protein
MIYIITALFAEAKPLIAAFHLKQRQLVTAFQVFESDSPKISLIISGTGPAAGAAAAGFMCGRRRPDPEDFLVNVGTAACLSSESGAGGRLFQAVRLKSLSEGRTFYPDPLYDLGLTPCSLATAGQVVRAGGQTETGPDQDLPLLYDMEAAGIYQAGLHFFGPHQMLFLKTVSDAGDGHVTAKSLEACIKAVLPDLTAVVERLNVLSDQSASAQDPVSEDLKALSVKLAGDLHLSAAMQIQLRQLVHFAAVSGIDMEGITASMYAEGRLPCRVRREGKVQFEYLRQTLLL